MRFLMQGFSRQGWLLAAALSSVVLVQCSGPKSEVVVSVKDQRMGIYSEGHLKKQYVVSTSKFGLGDKPGSNCTPLGKHEIIAKIGHGLPAGAVLKSRSWNGEVLKPNAPGRDPIVSRILWLRGMESSNRNAFGRYIYIHGTPEENRLGQPASYGCIRMGMKDVISVFNDLPIGSKVVITKAGLPHSKAEKQEAPVEALPAPGPEAPADSVPSAVPVGPNRQGTPGVAQPIANVNGTKATITTTEAPSKPSKAAPKGTVTSKKKTSGTSSSASANSKNRPLTKELAHR